MVNILAFVDLLFVPQLFAVVESVAHRSTVHPRQGVFELQHS
jgi:hypothetical protein